MIEPVHRASEMIANRPPQSLESLQTLLRALRRYWPSTLLFYTIAMLVTVGLLIIVPRKYMSEGKFFVNLGRGTVSIDPTATTGKNVSIQETRDAEINSVADILESRALIEQVVDTVGVDRILASNSLFDRWLKLPDWELPSLSHLDTPTVDGEAVDWKALKRREKAIRKLEDGLKVKPTKKAATISVIARASSPALAREIVNQLMTRYHDLHIKAHNTPGSLPFFEEQFALHKAHMVQAQDILRDYKNRIAVASIDGERNSIQSQIDRVQLDLIAFQADRAAANERVSQLDQQYDSLDSELITARVAGNANEGADLMRDRLFSLEMEEKELLARFHESHPDVLSVRDAIAKARQVVDDYPYDRKEVTTAANPTKLDLQRQLLTARAEASALAARGEALQAKQGELLTKLEALNQHEAEIEVLTRDLEVARGNFRSYAEKMEEARSNKALDAERISNVNVVQEPTFVVKAVSPKRLLILVLAAGFFLVLAIALALLRESWDQSLQSPDDLARTMGVPVLASLPRGPSRRVLVP